MSSHNDAKDPKDLDGSEIMKPNPKVLDFLSTPPNN